MNWYKKILTSDYKDDNINSMNKEFIIMRGCPSSGKSFLANQLAGEAGGIFSADDYHTDPQTQEYNWKPENVRAAHQWNHDRIKKAIEQGISPVIIDNTHIKKWELMALKPLVNLAQQNEYNVRIEEPNPEWHHWDTAFDEEALYERSKKTHKLPREAIQKMINNYEHNVSIDDILNCQLPSP